MAAEAAENARKAEEEERLEREAEAAQAAELETSRTNAVAHTPNHFQRLSAAPFSVEVTSRRTSR